MLKRCGYCAVEDVAFLVPAQIEAVGRVAGGTDILPAEENLKYHLCLLASGQTVLTWINICDVLTCASVESLTFGPTAPFKLSPFGEGPPNIAKGDEGAAPST